MQHYIISNAMFWFYSTINHMASSKRAPWHLRNFTCSQENICFLHSFFFFITDERCINSAWCQDRAITYLEVAGYHSVSRSVSISSGGLLSLKRVLRGNSFHTWGWESGSGASVPDEYDLKTCGINANMALFRKEGCMHACTVRDIPSCYWLSSCCLVEDMLYPGSTTCVDSLTNGIVCM